MKHAARRSEGAARRQLTALPVGLVPVLLLVLGAGCSDGSPAEPDPSAPGAGAAEGPGGAGGESGAQTGSRDAGPGDDGSDGEGSRTDATGPSAGEPDAGADAPAAGAGPRQRVDMRCQVDADSAPAVDYASPGPFMVGVLELVLEDSSRPIEATDGHPAAPSRLLSTRIYYPASAPPPLFGSAPLAGGGPFAMLMYSHGFSSSREESNRVGTHAASHGFVVVAPDYPLSNINANGGMPVIEDVANQPGDVAFLIDEVLTLSDDSSHVIAGAVDAERIGALGVSLGGLTTLLLGYHAELHEPRIKAVAPIAAPSFFFTARYYDTRDLPLLFFHGDLDAFIDYELNARAALETAAPSARLVTVEAGSHTGFGAPVDGALLGLVQPLFAPPDAHPMNPDGLGCGYVAADLQDTGPGFLDVIGGEEVGIVATEEGQMAALPCTGDEYTMPAIDLNLQMDILAAGVVAFFDAHLGADQRTRDAGCAYLLERLPRDPAVTLE